MGAKRVRPAAELSRLRNMRARERALEELLEDADIRAKLSKKSRDRLDAAKARRGRGAS